MYVCTCYVSYELGYEMCKIDYLYLGFLFFFFLFFLLKVILQFRCYFNVKYNFFYNNNNNN